jgi:hypothetical protein
MQLETIWGEKRKTEEEGEIRKGDEREGEDVE